jgi:hypothetical protein
MPTCDYTITYTDNSGDDHMIHLSKWEDAEKVATLLVTLMYTDVVLTDGYRVHNYSTHQVTFV